MRSGWCDNLPQHHAPCAAPHLEYRGPLGVQRCTEQSRGPAAPSSCSFLLTREADENINFTEQRPPLQSSQRAGSTEKCWVQLNSNQNQIKTREKEMFPVLGTTGRAGTSGSLWEPQSGMNMERFPVSQGSPMLSGRTARRAVWAHCPVSHCTSPLGQDSARHRPGLGGALL